MTQKEINKAATEWVELNWACDSTFDGFKAGAAFIMEQLKVNGAYCKGCNAAGMLHCPDTETCGNHVPVYIFKQ